MSQLRTFCALAAAPAACRLLRRTLRAAGGGVAPVKNGIIAALSACAVVAVVAVQSIAFTPDARAQTSNPCSAGQGVFPDGQCDTCPPIYPAWADKSSAILTDDGFCTCPEGEDFIAALGHNLCVSQNVADAFNKCSMASGWDEPSYGRSDTPGINYCRIPVRNVGQSRNEARCYLDDSDDTFTPHCTAVFGPDLVIPDKPTDGSAPRYVFNCDPDGDNGLIPATINTIGATECACLAGKFTQNGVCVAASAEVCGRFNPRQFYDAAADACVPFVECVSPEVLYADANDCHAASAYPLHDAVRAGDVTLVNHFIAEHEENIVNDADFFGATPLHAASNAATVHVTIAAALIAAGANVNATDIVGETPLHWAAEYGHASIVSLLIAATASLNLKNSGEGRTPLYMAARNGHVFVVSMLIAAKASLDVQGNFGQTPLHQAANYGRVTVADMLIAAGANLNVRSSGGDTPLYWAVFSNEVSIASALIAAGADVHAGQTAGLLWTPLLLAGSKGRASIADMLIAAGATLDARDRDNNTPLHLSAVGGHSAVVSLLLAATASVDAKNDDGEAPLHLSAVGGHSAVVSLLLAATASVDAKNDDGETPLHLSAANGRAAAVAALLAGGADVNAKDEDNETPLHMAVAGGHAAVAAALIAGGAYWGEAACGSGETTNPAGSAPPCVCESNAGTSGNCVAASAEVCGGLTPAQFYDAAADACFPFVDCVSPEVLYAETNDCHAASDYPLHDAVKAGDLDLVNHFVTVHMSDVNAKNNTYGDTPLHVAAQYDRASIAVALIAAGANVDAENSAGRTPQGLAYLYGNAAVARALIAAGEVCESGEIPNPGDPFPACVCEPPTVGTSGNCAAPSAESCGGLTPAQFYDAAAGACVPFVECAAPEVLYAETNDCHAASDYPLHDAAKAGDLNLVNHFVTVHMSDVNATNVSLEAPLHLAARAGHAAIAAALISATANANARSGAGGAPLHMAAAGGHVAVVSLLIAATASVDAKDNNGETPLHMAAVGGHVAVVSLLIAATASVDAKDNNGETPLHMAAVGGHAAAVSLLIAATASVDAKNDDGETPLHLAAGNGRAAAVAALLAGGAAVSAQDEVDETPLHMAAAGGHAAVAAALLAGGAAVNAQDEDDETPLHLAVAGGHAAVAAALVAAGAYWGDAACESGETTNPAGPAPPCLCEPPTVGTSGNCAAPSAESCGGLTPAQFYDAAAEACVPFVECAAPEVLYAEANDCHAESAHPLHDAVFAGDLNLANHFITVHMSDVNATNVSLEAPLHLAARAGHAAIAAALISATANVNARNREGAAPLHLAADAGHAAIVTALIAAGAYWGDAACGSEEIVNPAGAAPPCLNLLRQAVTRGDFSAVSALIAAGADVDARNANNNTALHLAAEAGLAAMVSLLIQATASLNVQNNAGNTPLHLSAAPLLLSADAGHVAAVSLLIQATASLNVKNNDGYAPLHLAIGYNHAVIVAALLAAGADVNLQDDDGNTPLYWAHLLSRPAIVTALIAAGAYWGDAACGSGEIVNPAGPIPPCLNLRQAVIKGDLSAASALLAAGADVDARDANNNTALHLAADAGRAAMVSLLIQATASLNVKNNAGNTPLHLSAEAGHVAVVSLLIQATASLNVKNNTYGDTPLHVAAFNGHAAIVDALIAAGAGVNEQNNEGQTPLHFGVYSHNVGIVDALIAARASVNAEDVSGQTPLWWAANIRRSFAIVAALIAAGAYWGDAPCESGLATNPVNSSPPCIDLHQAVRGGYVFAVATLIATGATLDAQDGDGDTPLHLAADGGHAVIASLLIQATASLNVQNDDGRTPLHLAVGGNHGGIVAALLAAKADVNLRDSDENTPLHWAHFLGRPALVADLIAAGGYWGAAACESGEIVNPAGPIPPCLCEPPTVGTAGNCAAPSAESCGGLDPAQFYDAAAGACVLFVECAPPEVLYPEANDCHAASEYPLHDAVDAGDLELVNHFITVHMADVNAADVSRNTPLHIAAKEGHASIVAALLAAGADVNLQDDDENTPLHLAAEAGQAVMVSLLIQATASLNVKNDDDKAPLHLAVDGGHAAIVALLIEAGAYWGDAACAIGLTANPAGSVPPCINLHQAAAGGRVFAVATLIATGATLDAQDGDGDTPLHLAAAGGHVAVVSLLIQATASLNVQNDDGRTPLHLAVGGNHAGVFAALLAARASVNLRDNDENTPLHWALFLGRPAFVADLIAAGGYWGDAPCESGLATNPAGPIPRCINLHQAAAGGHVFAVATLIATGATLDAQDGDGDTPLHLAAADGHAVIVSLLIQATASLNVKNDDEKAPLHLAADGGHAAIVALLIEAGAYWGDAACESGEIVNPAGPAPPCALTAVNATLLAEVEKGRDAADAAVVAALLDEDAADPDIKDADGRPLLILAARNGHAEIVSVLVTAGAEVNAADPVFRGFGAVHHAASALSGENAGGALGPWAARASVLYYFGGGLEVRKAASGDAVFVWNREDDNGFRPLDLLVDSLGAAADAAERVLLQEMADYLIARGGECGVKTADRSQPACRGTLRGLLDEVEKATGAADVAVFSELLENRGADPDHADAGGRPLLILAARNGHAELVSILAVAGADVNATDPTFNNADVAHHLATPLGDPAAGPRGLRASVLRYFGGGLDVRRNTGVASAGFEWNREDNDGKRPLDLLADAEDESPRPEGEDVSVIYQMADYMLDRGANCGDATTNKGRRVCAGDPRFADARASLLAEVKKPRGAANATVVADLLGGNFVGPDIADPEGTPILIVAATLGHAEIVSVLVTAGAYPAARLRASICGGGSIGRAVPHVTARNNFGSSLYYTWGTALNVLRHFAGAVNQVGARYDWNARGVESDCVAESRALDYLRPRYDNDAASLPSESLDAKRAAMEGMAGVLVDNGASCENQANERHVTCVGPLPAVTVGYGENPRDQSGGTLSAPVVSGETTPYGTSLTFTAAPANGWKLSAWAGDAASCPSSELECALPAIGDLRVTALFARAPRALHASEPSNGGRVTVTGADGVAEGADFVYTGGTVTFTAIPANGWSFSAWAGDAAACPSSGLECALTANGDLRVTALFLRAPRALYSSDPPDESGGRVTALGTSGVIAKGVDFISSGEAAVFTAIPANGWIFSAWTGDCAGVVANICALLVATQDVSVGATFTDINECAASADNNCAAEDDGGLCANTDGDFVCSCAVGYSGDGMTCRPDKTVSFLPPANGTIFAEGGGATIYAGETATHGTTVTFIAAPAFGYRFSAWLGDCAGDFDLSCEVAATVNVSVGAVFTNIGECVRDEDCAADGGRCDAAGGVFDCVCDSGYSGDGMTCEADKVVSFLPSPNGTISAAGGGVSLQDGKTAAHGTTITFTAAPAAGYRFSGWFGDCAGAASCEVAATQDVSVGATFTDINECATSEDNNCAAEAEGGRCANTAGGFTCSCAAGYSGDGRTCEADKAVSFLPSPNGTISAAGGGVSLQDGKTAAHGTTITFTAAPAAGYRFSGWFGDCAGAASCEVLATLDVSVGATFTDIDECATSADNNCAAEGGRCANTAGGFTCSCAAGYSGDGRACEADKAVSFLPSPNGTISAAGGGVSFQDGKTAAHGTTITFTAAPAAGYRFSGWFGDCAGAASCEVAATLDVSVGATFTDIDECGTSADNCAAEEDGGLCANTAGDFTCSCVAGYSGDGRTCVADQTVSFLPSPNGAIFAMGEGGSVQDGGLAPRGTTITLIAAPDAGYQVSMWTGACAGTSVDASASRAFCEVVATAHINAGAIFTYIGRCATPGHLIFGAPPNRRCAPPTICPANYAGDNDCLPAAPAETGSPAPDLPAAANEPDACEKVFGGVMRSAGGGQAVCSNVDRNDTFCIAGSRAAFPCRGLFRHVWKCNTYNRPALNPFFCGERCEGENMARGRECGVEALDASQ